MNTYENIKKVALIFFIITGIAHLGSTGFILNGLYLKQSQIINKTMDIPFIITGLTYGLASLRLTLTKKDEEKLEKLKTLDIIALSIIILTLLALLIVNLLIPNL